MKTSFVTLALLGAALAGFATQADEVTTKISKVHLCCKSCVTGVETAIGKVSGVAVTVDQDAGTVSLSGPDAKTVQKAANALTDAGYFGKSSDKQIKIRGKSGAKGVKVQSLKVEGVHLCCGKCVKTVDEALKAVPGVTGHTAEKNAKSFEVNGDFNDKEIFGALHKAGFSGTIAK